MEGRFCYWIPEDQNPETYGGYVPSCVKFGIAGHFPMTGQGDLSIPWVWGKTLADAKEICKKKNIGMGLTEKDVDAIIASSMMAH